jgi:phosphohistidine phosphatase SixA
MKNFFTFITFLLIGQFGLISAHAQTPALKQPTLNKPTQSSEMSQQAVAKADTQILMIRHALAPGMGDPSNFDVNDCSTQRNLSQEGIDQAKTFGLQLKKLGFQPDQVWTSQWCRSFDTAQALGLGQVTRLPVLNSYFQNRSVAEQQIADLKKFIMNLPSKGGRYVMVTHHVLIGDLTGQWVGSGDGVWLLLTGNQNDPWRVMPFSSGSPALPKG